jgi:hypothetical protein
MNTGKIITGKLEFRRKVWDDDTEGWFIDGWNILNAIDIEKYENKKVRITIEEIDEDKNED